MSIDIQGIWARFVEDACGKGAFFRFCGERNAQMPSGELLGVVAGDVPAVHQPQFRPVLGADLGRIGAASVEARSQRAG